MTNAVTSPPAQLSLRGHEPKPADISLERRSRQTRMTKSVLSLVGFLILAPIVALIPPHIPWVILAVAAGFYFAYRQWTGEYVVHGFKGECPRCGNSLEIKPGSKIKLPMDMDCFQCHHQPTLEVDTRAVTAE